MSSIVFPLQVHYNTFYVKIEGKLSQCVAIMVFYEIDEDIRGTLTR